MSDSNVTQLPTNITFNLDEQERETKVEPFVALVGGRSITMTDPEELDWEDLLMIEGPYDFLTYSCSPEDKRYILAQKMPGWKFGKLIAAYQQHYGFDEKLAEARRRGLASGAIR